MLELQESTASTDDRPFPATTTRPRLAYILACSHSGSTLMAMLLGAHPDALTVGEITGARTDHPDRYRCSCGQVLLQCPFWNQIAAGMKARGVDYFPNRAGTDIRESSDRFIKRLLSPLHRGVFLEAARDLALSFYPGWHRHLDTVQRRNAALLQTLTEQTGASVVVDSGKVGLRLKYLLRNPLIDVMVIRLIRDGRGVALTWTDEAAFADASDPSVRGGGFGRAPIQFSPEDRRKQIARGAHVWRRSNQEAESLLARLPQSRWIAARYEQLCANPVQAMRPICDFLGLDPDKLQVNFRSVEQHVIGNGMRLDKVSQIRLDERWRTHLTQDDLAVFNGIAGGLNRSYGYA